jgi:Domain of unknown function (DUF1987).
MDALIIEGTHSTPSVKLYPSGEFYFKGRSLPEDPLAFYTPIIHWINNCKSDKITAEIYLEYMNTSSSKLIYTILRQIKDNPYANNININWLYDEGDEESYDLGCDFQEQTELSFQFKEYVDTDQN